MSTASHSKGSLLRLMAAKWPITLTLGVLGALLGGLFAATQPSVATSTSALYVSAAKPEAGTDPSQLTTAIQLRMYSYYGMTNSNTVLQPVIDKLKLDTTVNDLRDSVQGSVPANSMIIETQVTADSPEKSIPLANAVRDSLGNAIRDMSPDQSGGSPAVQIFNYQDASAATSVSKTSIPTYALAGLVAGLALAALVLQMFPRLARSGRIAGASADSHGTADPGGPLTRVLRREAPERSVD